MADTRRNLFRKLGFTLMRGALPKVLDVPSTVSPWVLRFHGLLALKHSDIITEKVSDGIIFPVDPDRLKLTPSFISRYLNNDEYKFLNGRDVKIADIPLLLSISALEFDNNKLKWPDINHGSYIGAFGRLFRLLIMSGHNVPPDFVDKFILWRKPDRVYKDIIGSLDIINSIDEVDVHDYICMSNIDTCLSNSKIMKSLYPDLCDTVKHLVNDIGWEIIQSSCVNVYTFDDIEYGYVDEPEWYHDSDDPFLKTKELFHEGL